MARAYILVNPSQSDIPSLYACDGSEWVNLCTYLAKQFYTIDYTDSLCSAAISPRAIARLQRTLKFFGLFQGGKRQTLRMTAVQSIISTAPGSIGRRCCGASLWVFCATLV
jgi:hypothetical protein